MKPPDFTIKSSVKAPRDLEAKLDHLKACGKRKRSLVIEPDGISYLSFPERRMFITSEMVATFGSACGM